MSEVAREEVTRCRRCGYKQRTVPGAEFRCAVCGAAPGPGTPLPVPKLKGPGRMPGLIGGGIGAGLLAVYLVVASLAGGSGATQRYTALQVAQGPAISEPFTEAADGGTRAGAVEVATETPRASATLTEEAPTATSTELPTAMEEPTITEAPATGTSTTMGTAAATATRRPTTPPTATAGPTYKGAFVADVTILDGTAFEPGEAFTKKWTVRNTGSAEWGPGVKCRFVKGTNLAGTKEYDVPATAPGAQVEIAVPMSAPAQPGTYRSEWQLCRAEGCFGTTVAAVIQSRAPSVPTATPAPTLVALATEVPTVVAAPAPAPRACCKICRKGKACGDTCINRGYTCHVGPGCACDG